MTIIDNLSTGRRENINPKAKFIEMDIKDEGIKELFAAENFDAINHQAAQIDVRTSVRDPRYDAEINILGSINLYQAAMESGVKKVVFASTGGAIYGEQEYFPADEDHPTRPCSPYGIAKLVNEKYLYYYREVFGLEYTILRYANVYGPRQNHRGEAGVVAIFVNKMLDGEQPVINGDGLNKRDYVFVGDVVRANLIAIEDECKGIYNVGTSLETDVNFIFRKLKELTGSNCDEVHGPAKAGEQRRSLVSYDKLNREFGWEPQVDFGKGMEETVEYFKGLREK